MSCCHASLSARVMTVPARLASARRCPVVRGVAPRHRALPGVRLQATTVGAASFTLTALTAGLLSAPVDLKMVRLGLIYPKSQTL
jgi:hypothetical protein